MHSYRFHTWDWLDFNIFESCDSAVAMDKMRFGKIMTMVDLYVPDAEEKESIKMELIEFNKSGGQHLREMEESFKIQ